MTQTDADQDTTKIVRDTLRRVLGENVSPGDVAQWDANNDWPVDLVDRICGLGFCGLTIPEEFGGLGRNIPAALAVVEELARVSPNSLAVPYIMSAFYGGMNIVENGTDAQKREFLPGLAQGKVRFAFGVTEPDVGSDVASVRTRAVQEGDTVRINGSKRFITGANIADYIYTVVKSGDRRRENISIVLVPTKAKGVTISKIESMGLRGWACTCDVTFDDVEVSPDLIIGGPKSWNAGWKMISGAGLDVERLEVAATSLGIAVAAMNDAWEYSQTRVQFGQLICGHQSVRHMLADMQTRLQACRLMLDHAARIAQTGRLCPTESGMAKLFICENARDIVLDAQTVMGAYGCVEGFDMERYARDALILPIAGGSSAIQRNNIAASLGLPKGPVRS